MKKKRLDIDYSYDFELLGLRTSAKGYKLAWELNSFLNLQLKKAEVVMVMAEGEASHSFDNYVHETPLNVLRLFRNRANDTDQSKSHFIPEHPHFDYIIMIQGEEHDSKRLQKELKAIPSIELVAFIPLDSLKSKDHFIF